MGIGADEPVAMAMTEVEKEEPMAMTVRVVGAEEEEVVVIRQDCLGRKLGCGMLGEGKTRKRR